MILKESPKETNPFPLSINTPPPPPIINNRIFVFLELVFCFPTMWDLEEMD